MYISEKEIRGKKYTYAEQSVRMPDGKKVNISKRIPKGSTKADLDEYTEYFTDKECELAAKWALENYVDVYLALVTRTSLYSLRWTMIVHRMNPQNRAVPVTASHSMA